MTRRLLFLIAAAALAGCTMGPDFRAPHGFDQKVRLVVALDHQAVAALE